MRSTTLARSSSLIAAALGGTLFLASCGAGTAGIVASAGGDGGSTAPSIAAFMVERPKEPNETKLRFNLSKDATVQLLYQLPGQDEPRPLTQAGENPRALAADVQTIPWNFALEVGLEAVPGASFHPGVRVFALIPGAQEQFTDGANGVVIGLGNDAPVVHAVDPMPTDPSNPAESGGNVEIRMRVSDTSSDPVDITVEWRRASAAPDAWTPATTTGVFPEGIETTSAPGRELSFFWNTNVDLEDKEDAVFLRATADDRTAVGTPVATRVEFKIDNNEEPIVQFDSGPVVTNPDERRGIPLPFRVFDEEGDQVEVIFQWRREGEEFPSLDTNGDGELRNDEIDAILADPALRAEHHICTAYPRYAQGLVVPVDATTVRLPELALDESWILASGIIGRTLEILRPSSILKEPEWAANPLDHPVAALPLGDGLTALVLDGIGSGRLRVIELATGAIVPHDGEDVIATIGGAPSAMSFERGEKAVLIAADSSGEWRIDRVELATGTVTELIVSDGSQPGPVRGIASLGTKAAVFTVGSALFHLDYRDPLAPQLGTILSDLASPWGVAVDPLPPDRVYVSERDADRVLAVELDSHGTLPVVVKTEDGNPATLKAPEALAIERSGSRLVLVTTVANGDRQLVVIGVGARGRNVRQLASSPVIGDVTGLATGPAGMQILTQPSSHLLIIGGGVEQKRVVTSFDPRTTSATVEPAFSSGLRPGARWRVHPLPLKGQPLGSGGRATTFFVWDSTRDFPVGGQVLFRAVARDEETGPASTGSASSRIRSFLDADSIPLESAPVDVGDLDNDGDLDLLTASPNGLQVLFQETLLEFVPGPEIVGPLSGAVCIGDLDNDGDNDIAAVSISGNNLRILTQFPTSVFTVDSNPVGGPGITNDPREVLVADLDGNGANDLVCLNSASDDLRVFKQGPLGQFAPDDEPVGGAGVTSSLTAMGISDLDGDGDLDLVAANGSANGGSSDLRLFIQDLRGEFAFTRAIGGPTLTEDPSCVASGDLDGDGDQDLVCSNLIGSNLRIFFQGLAGDFSLAEHPLGRPNTTLYPRSVAIGDLDGDGDQDLISANGGTNLTAFFQASEGGFLDSPLTIGDPPIGLLPTSVAVEDLDGDGSQDLLFVATGPLGSRAILQLGPSSFRPQPLLVGGYPETILSESVAAADLDMDGDPDLVSADAGDLRVFFQEAPRRFTKSPKLLGSPGPTYRPMYVAAGDLDGDGSQDVVSANSAGDDLRVFFQSSPGEFTADLEPLGGAGLTDGPLSVAIGDLDMDGDQDLVSANSDGDDLRVFFQSSPGEFTADLEPLGGAGLTDGPLFVAIGDLDMDGDLDLVSANSDGDDLRVFFQSSPGEFTADLEPLGGAGLTDGPLSVAIGDLDMDGDQDLVSANLDGGDLRVFFQSLPGEFAADLEPLGGAGLTDGPLSVAIGDHDMDGDLDVATRSVSRKLTVFFQNHGGFGEPPLIVDAGELRFPSRSLLSTDLDGDGDRDLVANDSTGIIGLFFGGN